MIIMALAILILCIFPEIVTWLPDKVMGKALGYLKKKINRKISVAPMMDCTDRHDRYFLRLISKNVMLYTEMVVTKAVLRGDKHKLLNFNNLEKPLALQVGGSDKKELAEVAKIAEDYGYDEVNINLGCPSKKVQKNSFGACLMKEPDLVSECLAEMQKILPYSSHS